MALIATSIPAAPTGWLDFGLVGRGVREPYRNASVAGTELDLNLSLPLTPYLEARAGWEANLESGTNQESLDQKYAPRKTVEIREALIEAKWNWGKIQVGALDQSLWGQPIFLTSQTFPAITETLYWDASPFKMTLLAEQAVASDSTETPFSIETEKGLPTFSFERLRVESHYAKGSSYVEVSHFLFQNLSFQSALSSQYIGSPVLGLGDRTRRFTQGFRGWAVNVGTSLEINASLKPSLKIGGLKNSEALLASQSVYAQINLPIEIFPWGTIQPSALWFQNEAKSVPALYANSHLGFINRRGWQIALDIEASQWGPVFIHAEYVSSQPIQSSPNQGDFNLMQVGVSHRYAF